MTPVYARRVVYTHVGLFFHVRTRLHLHSRVSYHARHASPNLHVRCRWHRCRARSSRGGDHRRSGVRERHGMAMTAWRFTRARGSVFAYGCVCVCVPIYSIRTHVVVVVVSRVVLRPSSSCSLCIGEKNERNRTRKSIDQSNRSISCWKGKRGRGRTTRRLDDSTTTSAGQGVGVGGTNHRPRGVRARVNVSVSVERERASGVDVRAKVCVGG